MGHPNGVIPSHPMGLICIAFTVPGTFGISYVSMDICWKCWTCGPFISSSRKPGHIRMYILFTRCTIHNGIVATIYIHILTTLPASLSLELIDHRHAGWLAYIQCSSPKESLPLTWLNCSKNNALTGQFG